MCVASGSDAGVDQSPAGGFKEGMDGGPLCFVSAQQPQHRTFEDSQRPQQLLGGFRVLPRGLGPAQNRIYRLHTTPREVAFIRS